MRLLGLLDFCTFGLLDFAIMERLFCLTSGPGALELFDFYFYWTFGLWGFVTFAGPRNQGGRGAPGRTVPKEPETDNSLSKAPGASQPRKDPLRPLKPLLIKEKLSAESNKYPIRLPRKIYNAHHHASERTGVPLLLHLCSDIFRYN